MGTRLISPFIFQPTKGKVEFRSFAVGFNVQRGTIGLSEPGVHVNSWRGTPENALFIQSLKRWMPLLACIVQNNKFTEFQYLHWYHLKTYQYPMDRHNTRASSKVHEWSQTLYHCVPCTIFTVPVVEEVPTNTTWLFTTKVPFQGNVLTHIL